MPLILNIAFDNTKRLQHKVYYFEYKGYRFKIIQNNPTKWADILMTIVPDENETANEKIRRVAGEFLSALSWSNNSRISLWFLGYNSVPKSGLLRSAKCRWRTFPLSPFDGKISGYNIEPIPAIETEEQRLALTLFREANSSNKMYLSFLFYWQILEIGGNEPIGWINKLLTHSRGDNLPIREVRMLPLGAKKLGEYLSDDCRHAIAHIRRYSGKASLKFDAFFENKRLSVSTYVVKEFARQYIIKDLHLTNSMWLVSSNDPLFPVFVKR